MDRDERRRLAGRHHRIDRRRDLLPIRRPESCATAGDLGCVDVGVARHDRTVGVAHDQRRIVQAPVRIDDQTRIGRQNGRRAEHSRKSAGRVGGANVIGDVAINRFTGHAKRAVTGGNGVRGMIADDERAAIESARKCLKGGMSDLVHPRIDLSHRSHLRDCS